MIKTEIEFISYIIINWFQELQFIIYYNIYLLKLSINFNIVNISDIFFNIMYYKYSDSSIKFYNKKIF